MQIRPTIMKFGGTSVADFDAFRNVSRIVRAATHPVVVVSAISGFTNALVDSVETAAAGNAETAARSLDPHFARHEEIAKALLPAGASIEFHTYLIEAQREIGELHGIIAAHPVTRAPLADEILSLGEQLSSRLLAFVLQNDGGAARYIDARQCIKTDDNFGCAAPLAQTASATQAQISSVLAAGETPVLGGFIGSTLANATTTLGRGGSDYTAALVGAALDAAEIQIWTDVSGVLTADPRVVAEARTIPVLSYKEAAELAYFGAKVLHPKTIQPAVERDIPVRVCNSRAPRGPATLIVSESAATAQTVKAIAHKNGITTLQITSARMLGAYGFLRALFDVFARHHTAVDVVTTSEVSVSLSLDDTSAMPQLMPELAALGTVEVEGRRTIISVVGEGLRNTPGIAARLFSTLNDINVAMISFGSSSVNLTFMVEEEHAPEAIQRLHRACFESESADVSDDPADTTQATAREAAA